MEVIIWKNLKKFYWLTIKNEAELALWINWEFSTCVLWPCGIDINWNDCLNSSKNLRMCFKFHVGGIIKVNFFKVVRAIFPFKIWGDQNPFILTNTIPRFLYFSPCHRVPINGENPKHRSWHTLTPIADDKLFLFGGLSADNIPLSKSIQV